MADNQLIYKVVPTIISNNVEIGLENFQEEYIYTQKQTFSDFIIDTDGVISLPSAIVLPNNSTFIEFISPIPLTLLYEDASGSQTLSQVSYLSGNILGFNFTTSTVSTEAIFIKWSFYSNE